MTLTDYVKADKIEMIGSLCICCILICICLQFVKEGAYGGTMVGSIRKSHLEMPY